MVNILSIGFGLLSALSFGCGDFSGGYATKKNNVFQVLLYSQIAGLLFLLASIFILGETLYFDYIILGLASGLFGGLGLLAFYRGLSLGNMGIVAPITAVVTPIIPFLYSFLHLNYSFAQILGIILALIAIWLVSNSKSEKDIQITDVTLAISAGIGFGFFLLFIDMASTDTSYFYPIVFARISSIFMISCVIVYFRIGNIPNVKNVGLMALVGVLDTVGNIFFILSSKSGRVDFATILLSLGPVVVVILAWQLLHEKLTKIQVVGIILSVIAVSLLSI